MAPCPSTVLLATTNPAKQEKLAWLLDGLGVKTLRPQALRLSVKAAESAGGHLRIARGKAVAWSRAAGMAAIASDGGLVIPALGPRWDALRTARFAGEEAGDLQRIAALLELMRPHAGERRAAHWVEAAAIAERGRVLASWQAESPPGLLAESYNPSRVIRGFWAFSLWVPHRLGRAYAELTPGEREQAGDHWARLRQHVRAYFQAGRGG